MKRVPFGNLAAEFEDIREDILHGIMPVLERGWFVLGRELVDFEQRFADYCGTNHFVGCGNGTDAITLSLLAAGLTGAEVVTSANTCVPTVAGIRDAGCTVRLADCDPDTLQLDPDSLEQAITPATRAVVAVHLYGTMCRIDTIRDFCNARKIVLIEDCAQAHGARLMDVPAGATGLLAAWSFYPSKNLGAYGDAGGVSTSDSGLAERLKRLRNYGQRERYFHEEEGRNSRLDELQAAILSAKLLYLETWNRRRREIASIYDTAFAGSNVRTLRITDGCVPARHLYPIRVNASRRDQIRESLSEHGVETLIHYPLPIHWQAAYKAAFANLKFPNAETAARELISLPLYPQMTDDEVNYVCEQVVALT